MPRTKSSKHSLVEEMLNEASWLITHADSLKVYGRQKEAEKEWLRAAACEQRVACLLDATGRADEAAVHRVSAGSCFALAGNYAEAVTLLRSALSFSLQDPYRRELEGYLQEWLPKAVKQLRREGAAAPSIA